MSIELKYSVGTRVRVGNINEECGDCSCDGEVGTIVSIDRSWDDEDTFTHEEFYAEYQPYTVRFDDYERAGSTCRASECGFRESELTLFNNKELV